MKLVVGLGNPGPEYAWSRHNAGWLVLDSYTERLRLGSPRTKFGGAFWPPSPVEGDSVAFLKPFTYMNLSGKSVIEAARYHDVEPESVCVVFDDAAIPFGKLRFRASGSAGGHKGMISVISALDTLDVPRIRIGVGAPPEVMEMKDWVLGRFPKEQRDLWPEVESSAWDLLVSWLGGRQSQGVTVQIQK